MGYFTYSLLRSLSKGLFVLFCTLFLMGGQSYLTAAPVTSVDTPQINISSQKKATIFSVAELEKLGVSTIEESMDLVKAVAQKQQAEKAGYGRAKVVRRDLALSPEGNADITSFFNTLSLNDLERIEITPDGNQVKYHLSKSLTKEGVTALFTFTIIEETAESKLDPIVTTPTKSPIRASELGDVVRVIHAEELDTLGVSTIEEALSLVGNVSVSDTGGIKTLFMRGGHSGSTKVLYNGIDLRDVTSTNAAPDFKFIPIEDVKRIEIISGSKGVMHGSGAISGVINIITDAEKEGSYIATKVASGKHLTSLKTTLNMGSFRTYVLGTQSMDNTLSSLKAGTEKDLFTQQSIMAGFVNNRLFSGSFDGSYTFISNNQDLDEAAQTSLVDDPDSFTKSTRHLLSLGYSFDHHNVYTTSVRTTHSSFKREAQNDRNAIENPKFRDADYDGNVTAIDLSNEVLLTGNRTLIAGADFSRETGSFQDDRGSFSQVLNRTSQKNMGYYTEFRWINPILSTQIGGRLDLYSKNFQKTAPTYHVSLFRKVPVIELNARWTYKTGLRIPSLYEQFIPFSGNKNLSAERSKTTEMTLSKQFGKLVVSSTYFRSRINDFIDYQYTNANPDDPYEGYYVNGVWHKQEGMEYAVELRGQGAFQFLRLDYITQTSKKKTTVGDDGTPVPAFTRNNLKVPDYKLTASTGVRLGKWSYGVFFNRVGGQEGYVSATEVGKIPAFHYVDVTAHYKFDKSTNLYTKVHNLTAEEYEDAPGYSRPGRTLYFGLKRFF